MDTEQAQSPTLQSLISADRLPAVEKALLQTFNAAAPSDIQPLSGGFSASPVYKIVMNGLPFVLKLNATENPADKTPQTNQADQALQTGQTTHTAARPACMEIAANAGIAPPLYYLNIQNGLSITGFIERIPLRTAFTSPDKLLAELAKTIRSIHALPPFPKENSLLDIVEGLISDVKGSPMFTETIFGDFFEYYDLIRKHYPWHDMDKVPSHNDLNPNNIICDAKKIWIVDWDAAFQNDRYVDLAIAANFFITGETEEKLFLEKLILETYFGKDPDAYKTARFFIMRQTCRLIYAVLMFKLAHPADLAGIIDNRDPQAAPLSSGKALLSYGKALLNEALNDMRSPRFISSVKLLS